MINNIRCLTRANRNGHRARLAAVAFLGIILGGCQAAQLNKLREGIRQADDGLTAAKAGLEAALPNLSPSHAAYAPLSRAKPYVDKAHPMVHELRTAVDQAEDIPALIGTIGSGYRKLGLPYGELVGGGASALATILGLFWRRDRKRAHNIVRAIESAKAGGGVVDFNDAETKLKLHAMGDGAKTLVAAALK